MAELNNIRFLLFFLLMIFPAHAIDVILSRAGGDFKEKSEIRTNIVDGEKTYVGTSSPFTYRPQLDTSKVIIYIIDRSRFVEIIRNAVREITLQIAEELGEWHYELVFLGIDNFDDDEYHLITGFIDDTIKRRPGPMNFTIETIGENHFDRVRIEKYQENVQICGGILQARLRDISRGALRPVGSNGKEIRLYGYYPTAKEVKWLVGMKNGTYSPDVNVTDPMYNFRLRYKTKKICLLILGRNEYSRVTSYGARSTLMTEMKEILEDLISNNEGLFIMGAFNFDWTEIDVVTQIILAHSVGWHPPHYNIFTCGYGMFNTNYRNMDVNDTRNIQPQPNSYMTELIGELMGEEVKERAIKMYYCSYGWKELEMQFETENGQYVPAQRFKHYTFPWVNLKIVFIVYDSTESNNPIDIRTVYQSMGELKQSGIYVVGVEAINFRFDDMHIIAEWIDYHRGLGIQNFDGEVIDLEQIAVLGGGNFDTIFQSKLTTYKTLFHSKKNELKKIRNYFVKNSNVKRVFAADVDNPNCEVWTYPMNTINGVYEPDLIPDKNMFGKKGGRKILFVITSANRFHQISAMQIVKPITPSLREKIERQYPCSTWKIFLVGLDNLKQRDYHLFAELVKVQTHDDRFLDEFVRIFNYGIGATIYQYKDNAPLPIDNRLRLQSRIESFFELIY